MPTSSSPSTRLSTSLTLAAFLLALGLGLVHPLAITAHHDGVACHEHADGHLDPAGDPDSHDHTCVFCHLAQTLSQTVVPPATPGWHHARADVRLDPEVAARPDRVAARPIAARAPPRV